MVIGAILIDKRDGSSQKLSSVKLQSNFDEAVKLISRLRSNYSSIHGLRYRSMICTIARNNPHIAEFLLRNIISGFSHIVVYDNNRILAGYDSNISTVLESFIAAGVVTHVPWQQNTTKLLQFKYQQTQAKECITKYGIHADWVAYIDTDEFFYFEKQNVAANTLNDLLVELEQHPLCAIGIRWIYMYGEGRMLRPNRTLFESYPRICKTGLQKKVLGRASKTVFHIPHGATCKNTSNQIVMTWARRNNAKIGLIHYYSRSVEEFLIKVDQGFPPYMVSPIQYYTYTEKVVCDIMEFNYSQDYRRIFINAYKQLKMLYSLTPIDLLPSSGLNLNQTSFHALSMHLQYRCAKKQEFDNERYLTINPGAKEAIRNRTYTDGLHHFMATFSSGAKGCWKTDTYSICE
ncbi:unnamed protein product [Rotaria sordida]|uniref:Glycosyltransferase family 92 protein n=1 Tax=Rotaria sordida TaxID=392033 RepID=A0A815P4V7_9BILA|nr:unnamed protein product [Rotaria sordida]